MPRPRPLLPPPPALTRGAPSVSVHGRAYAIKCMTCDWTPTEEDRKAIQDGAPVSHTYCRRCAAAADRAVDRLFQGVEAPA